MRRKVLSLCCLLWLSCLALWGQLLIIESYPQGVDFWVVMPYNSLQFRQNDTAARYQLAVEVVGRDKRPVFSQEQVLEVPRRDWLRDTALPVSFQADLEPGKYQVLLRLRNLELGDKSDLKTPFVLESSFTEIGQAWLLARKDGISFIPASLQQVPRPVELCEIRQRYSLAADSVLVQADEQILRFVQPARGYTADLTPLVNYGPVSSLRISLFEDNIRYNMDPFYYDRWFSYNVRYEYKDQLQQLRYIANQNEWNTLRKVPEEMYPEAIERFWQVHDPSPGTLRNEAREAFYRRVITADERYTIHKRLKGWKSDRGRIYIKYGEPDEIRSEVHPIGLYPYIIWSYYSRNLEFEFEDTGGFGQYKLRNKDEEF